MYMIFFFFFDSNIQECQFNMSLSAICELTRVEKSLRRLVHDELLFHHKTTFPQARHRMPGAILSLFPWQNSMANNELDFLILLFQIFADKARHATYTGRKRPHSLRIPFVGMKFHSDSSQENLHCGKASGENVFTITIILTTSNLGLAVIALTTS